jgi:hypothetical protein
VANREQRRSREQRKPKAEKPKPAAAQVSPFARAFQDAGMPKGYSGKRSMIL